LPWGGLLIPIEQPNNDNEGLVLMENTDITFELHMGSLPRERRSMLAGLSPVDDERWNLRMDHAAFYVIARDGDFPVGFGFAERPWGIVGESWAKHVTAALELGGLIVRPEYRRKGVMSELVRLRVETALQLGYKPVCVTLADNANVIAYYSSRGWAPKKQFNRNGVILIPWVLESEPITRISGYYQSFHLLPESA
jgi:GNAT superfamily N-acetyltransferase